VNAARLVVDDATEGVFRVHRSAFVSSEILAREQKLIFDRSWLYVGHESEITNPSDFLTRKAGGRTLIFTRDRAGAVRVLLNTCRHRGAEVCRDRTGNRKVFTCFYHGWAYANDGTLVSVPDGDSYSPGFRRAEHGLHQPRVESYRGFVFVTFSGQAPGLVEYLADAAYLIDLVADQSESGMDLVVGTHQYTMKANWKLLMENSCDGYHGFTVHQTYFEMMMNLGVTPGLVATPDDRGRAIDLGNGHAVAESPELGMPLMNDEVRAATARRRGVLVERFGEAHVRKMLNTTRNTIIFPNFALIDLNFGIQVRTMYPTAPDHTEITGWQLMPRDAADSLKAYRLDNALTFWGPAGLATPDDIEGLEQCQRGFASLEEVAYSDISRGMMSAAPSALDELQMRTFWRRWNELLTGEPARSEGSRYDASYVGADLANSDLVNSDLVNTEAS
jgi:p-cumate 2,3-dioxygenase subunit alpha